MPTVDPVQSAPPPADCAECAAGAVEPSPPPVTKTRNGVPVPLLSLPKNLAGLQDAVERGGPRDPFDLLGGRPRPRAEPLLNLVQRQCCPFRGWRLPHDVLNYCSSVEAATTTTTAAGRVGVQRVVGRDNLESVTGEPHGCARLRPAARRAQSADGRRVALLAIEHGDHLVGVAHDGGRVAGLGLVYPGRRLAIVVLHVQGTRPGEPRRRRGAGSS